MNREFRQDKESDVTSLEQSEHGKSFNEGFEVGGGEKDSNKVSYFSELIEKVLKFLLDESENKKKTFLKTVAQSIAFSLVVLIALAPPITTVAAIIYGLIHGFSWMLILIPMLMWILTGLLTVRLIIYKTGIKFKC